MKVTIDFKYFEAQFKKIRPLNFSQEGLEALYNYLMQWEYTCSDESEFNVIELCAYFEEWGSIKEFNAHRNTNYEDVQELVSKNSMDIIPVNFKRFITTEDHK